MKLLATISGILCVLVAVVGFWWWALLGIPREVGAAIAVTSVAFFIGSFAAAMFSS